MLPYERDGVVMHAQHAKSMHKTMIVHVRLDKPHCRAGRGINVSVYGPFDDVCWAGHAEMQTRNCAVIRAGLSVGAP